MPPTYYVPTDWGVVEQDVITRLRACLTGTDARAIKSALSEDAADALPKGLNSIYTVSHGTEVSDTGEGGGNHVRLDEEWTVDVVIYSASGKAQDIDRSAIQTLSARVKGILNGYSPSGQIDNNGWLQVTRDAPVESFTTVASSGLKIRQTYVLRAQLLAQIVGVAAA